MRTNLKTVNHLRTHEGAPAVPSRDAMAALRRKVSSCFLWEKEFYEDGVSIAERIRELAMEVSPADLAALAVEARSEMHLRHASLWLVIALLDHRAGAQVDVAGTIAEVCRRADEPGELLAMFWKDGRRPIPAAMKRGLARAMRRFDGYQLAKYDRNVGVRQRDVMRMTHPRPLDEDQSGLWKDLLAGELRSADTWEVALSSGADSKESFERLLKSNRMPYLALLRNLRNMDKADVDVDLVRDAILARRGARDVLPFRYVAAARAAPRYEPWLEEALCASIEDQPVFEGETVFLVDVSGSMSAKLSAKSDLTRLDAAATLASVMHGRSRVFTFSTDVREIAPRKGMAGVAAISARQTQQGTLLGAAIRQVNALHHDRLVVITDEQSHDVVGAPAVGRAYMINVASASNGVGYGDWTRISGFSESILRFMHASESDDR